jgi:hypothetical protein
VLAPRDGDFDVGLGDVEPWATDVQLIGAGVPADPERKENAKRSTSVDVAPSLLANVLGVEPGPMMKGIPSMFSPKGAATCTASPAGPMS